MLIDTIFKSEISVVGVLTEYSGVVMQTGDGDKTSSLFKEFTSQSSFELNRVKTKEIIKRNTMVQV